MHKVTIKPLAGKLEFYFSHSFQDTIWNMVMVPGKSVLVLEIRNEERRQVSFSAIDFNTNQFLWTDIKVSEAWWVNLFSAKENSVVLRKFENTDNPDSVSYIHLNLLTSSILTENQANELNGDVSNVEIIVPAQYHEGTDYFETVKKFVQKKINGTPVHVIEYLEDSGLIFSSVYMKPGPDLENYLLVFDNHGELIIQEKMGVGLKGLGLETFFIHLGYLFFVKNKVELVTYRIV